MLRTLPFALFFLLLNTISAQVFINKEWTNLAGNPTTGLEWSASINDQDQNIYTVGHTVTTTFGVDLFLLKKNKSGQTIWQQQFSNSTNSKDYGVAITFDQNGDLCLAGATLDPLSNTHDYLVLKYDTSGVLLWSAVHDGPGNDEDVPTAITTDTSNNVYVTGGSFHPSRDYDYWTIKLNASGQLIWDENYDHNNKRDGATDIIINPLGEVVVTGGSFVDNDNWDYATLKYNTQFGTPLGENRLNSGAVGLDMPTGFTTDGSGNIYLAGYGSSNGTDNDFYTVKLDEDLDLVWSVFYGSTGIEERGQDVVVNAQGEVYATGYVDRQDGGRDYLTIKYSSNGQELWAKKRSPRENGNRATAYCMALDALDNVVISGEELRANGDGFFKTVSYSPDGDLLWEDIHNQDELSNEKPLHILLQSNGDLVVSGQLGNQSAGKYQQVQYAPFYYTPTFDYTPDSIISNVHEEIIVRFYPTVVDTAFADDVNLTYSTVEKIITDQSLITEMDTRLGAQGRLKDWKMRKIYPRLTTSDRFITSRFGEQVPLAAIWSTYMLLAESSMEEATIADTLSSIGFEQIMYAEVNRVAQYNAPPPPNDPFYANNQGALNTSDPNANINIEPVWDAGITGSGQIRVGLVDSGLNFDHPDFGFGGNYGGIGGSVVGEGFDIILDSPIDENDTDNDNGWGHGTRMAGIIGALRNNNEGISGVAGGDIANSTRGVDLHIYRAGNPGISFGSGSTAIVEVATNFAQNDGPTVDILNNSWGQAGAINTEPGEEDFMFNSLLPAYKSGLITVFSRGNEGNDELHPPATLMPEWVISVGGSGLDGRLKVASNSSNIGFNEGLQSSYGLGMDLIAPATNGLITSINNQDPTGTSTTDIFCEDAALSFNADYTCSNGSSSSAAFVSGASALLLQQHREAYAIDLTFEDIERLLSYGATDIVQLPDIPAGYDDRNGWGRLNVDESYDLINNNNKIIHFRLLTDFEVLCDLGCSIELTRAYESPFLDAPGIIPPEVIYSIKVRRHQISLNINLCTELGISSILDPGSSLGKAPAWINNSRSNLWGAAFTELPNGNAQNIVPIDQAYWLSGPAITNSGCNLEGTLAGMSYELTSGDEAGAIIPHPGFDAAEQLLPHEIYLSVLVNDPNDLVNEEVVLTSTREVVSMTTTLQVWPNPTDNWLQVRLPDTRDFRAPLQLFDARGRLLNTYSLSSLQNTWRIPTSDLPAGIYFLRAQDVSLLATGRFIKL